MAIKTSDESLDYFDAIDDLSDHALKRYRGPRSEEEELSELFDDPYFDEEQEEDLDE